MELGVVGSARGTLVCVDGFEPPAPRFQAENSDQTELHTEMQKAAADVNLSGLGNFGGTCPFRGRFCSHCNRVATGYL